MNRRGSFRQQHGEANVSAILWSFVVMVAAAAVIAFLYPLFARPHIHSNASGCECNMKQMGSAFKMYLQDWHDTYPTNRSIRAGKLGPISCHVQLTPAKELPSRQNKGRNMSWVEALYPYMEPPSDLGSDNVDVGAWECRLASTDCYPRNSRTAYTTYAMNANLVGLSEKWITSSDRLMLVRELDRHANAALRPANKSTKDPDSPPQAPFLARSDLRIGRTKAYLHGKSSHILFADSHVKWFPVSMMPDRITKSRCWDAQEKIWYNYANVGDTSVRKTIAITP